MKELIGIEMDQVTGGTTVVPRFPDNNFEVLDRLTAQQEWAWMQDMMPTR